MRFECKRTDAKTKWYEINLMPMSGDIFVVVVSYGVKGVNEEDTVLQPILGVFAGDYSQALEKIDKKVKDRLSIGYIKIEPKQVNE